jgi:ABC-type amino acid transport substrate-binding protein
MLHKLKPVPRALVILTIVGGLGYAALQYLPKQAVEAPTVVGAAAPVPGTFTITPMRTAVPAGNAYKTMVDSGVVRVSVQSPSKPFFSVEHGATQGFNVDFMTLLFQQPEFTSKHAQITINTDHMVDTYADVPAALIKDSTVDIAIDGLTFSDSDLPGVVYTIPYVDDFGYSLIAPSTAMVKGPDAINGMTIGILAGDPDVKAFVSKQFPQAKLVELSDATIDGGRNWINHFIKNGSVDAVIYDYPFGVAEIKGTDLQFAISKLPGSDIKYKIAVRKADTELLQNLNMAIRKVKANPSYIEVIKKYFMSTNVKVAVATKNDVLYTVKTGDTLSKIAAAKLGNPMRFGEIETRNNLPNPNLIQVGQQLVLPKL